MKKYLILFNSYARPATLYKHDVINKVLAVCDTLEIAKKYCEKLAKDTFGEDGQKEFDWHGDKAYVYSEELDCSYFTIKSTAWYIIEEIKYVDQV